MTWHPTSSPGSVRTGQEPSPQQQAGTSTLVPACPAGPDRVIAVAQRQWGISVDPHRYRTALKRRADTMVDRRLAGDATNAAITGWLSLAAILAGGGARVVTALARAESLNVAAIAADAGVTISDDPNAPDLPASSDPAGFVNDSHHCEHIAWQICKQAASAAGTTTMVVDGRYQSSSAVTNRIRAALTSAVASRRIP